MDISFDGKRVLVTRAAGVIGKAITELLVKCGATVIAVDVRGDVLQALYGDCPQVIPTVCDLAKWETTRAMVTNHLPIDLLVNSAGRNSAKLFLEFDVETIDQLFEVNVKALINISQVVIKDWMDRKSEGAIVNLSSILCRGGSHLASVYSSTKAAVSSLTESMAVEYGQHGIRVNAVRPGGVKTPVLQQFLDKFPGVEEGLVSKSPTGRLSTGEDIAQTVCFLLSERASNITGTELIVDGGVTSHTV